MGYQPFERKFKKSSQPKEEHHMQAEWDAIAEEQWKRSATKQAGDALTFAFGQTALIELSHDGVHFKEVDGELVFAYNGKLLEPYNK